MPGSCPFFTCISLLSVALESAKACGVPKRRIYILDVPKELIEGREAGPKFKTSDHLVEEGSRVRISSLEPTKWKDDGLFVLLQWHFWIAGILRLTTLSVQETNSLLERSYDFPPQCYRKRDANHSFREHDAGR